MLRITQIPTAESAVLRLEGKLLEAWVPSVRDACREARRAFARVELDLAHVAFVDSAGRRLLGELLREGVMLGACSSFVCELLNVEDCR